MMHQHYKLLTVDYCLTYLSSHIQNGMFDHAYAFNQDIGNWDVSTGTSFVSITTKNFNVMTLKIAHD